MSTKHKILFIYSKCILFVNDAYSFFNSADNARADATTLNASNPEVSPVCFALATNKPIEDSRSVSPVNNKTNGISQSLSKFV